MLGGLFGTFFVIVVSFVPKPLNQGSREVSSEVNQARQPVENQPEGEVSSDLVPTQLVPPFLSNLYSRASPIEPISEKHFLSEKIQLQFSKWLVFWFIFRKSFLQTTDITKVNVRKYFLISKNHNPGKYIFF